MLLAFWTAISIERVSEQVKEGEREVERVTWSLSAFAWIIYESARAGQQWRGGSGVGREWGLQSALITHFAASDCCWDCCRVCCYARYSCCCCCCCWRFVAVIINNIFIINVLWRRSSVVASVAANHLPQDRAQLHFIIYSTCARSNLPHGGREGRCPHQRSLPFPLGVF